MGNMLRVLVTIGILIGLLVVFFFITGSITKVTGLFISENVFSKEDMFMKCLEERDIALYLNSENVDVTLSDVESFDFLSGVDIFNCAENNQVCVEKGVNDFSKKFVWIIEGEKVLGDVGVEELSELSGCGYF